MLTQTQLTANNVKSQEDIKKDIKQLSDAINQSILPSSREGQNSIRQQVDALSKYVLCLSLSVHAHRIPENFPISPNPVTYPLALLPLGISKERRMHRLSRTLRNE